MRSLPESTLLAVVDIQEKLLTVVPAGAVVVDSARRLVEAARILGVRMVVTEQYPKGLGRTPSVLGSMLPAAIEKQSFSCCGADAFSAAIDDSTVETVVLVGLETHVCIQQTALDLIARGIDVVIVVDAVASRHAIDHDTAVARLSSCGANLTTMESLLFEWCRSASHPRFQDVRRLVLDRPRAAPRAP